MWGGRVADYYFIQNILSLKNFGKIFLQGPIAVMLLLNSLSAVSSKRERAVWEAA